MSVVDHAVEHQTVLRLERRIADLEKWIRDEGERGDICTYWILREICVGCKCHRAGKVA